ncbi:LysR substrate-binding domain-containing protein [Microbulbifer taiwanensis]|uniref:LysR substrate-binding domain-containing protein n=1 Tax=Microbulbifer taiwanensis TaxID=986746 RepID=A0ABW1YMC3_9GAMM|nr:LysR substrate-binding domain-containing protein [Microbulbifer taiwanensis]
MPTLDLQALRAFVCGIELDSFALAARRLHRSTSAVSAQLKKLERQVGSPLVQKRGRRLVPTRSGELLLSYARQLLALNDEALQAVGDAELAGELRFAAQEDFGESLLAEVLGRFARAHPQVQLSTFVGRNADLLDGLRGGRFDLALGWGEPQPGLNSERLLQAPLRWLAAADFPLPEQANGDNPVPLVMFERPCIMRARATEALDRAGIRWRVVHTSHSLSGIWAAVKAGLGITLRSDFGRPPGLVVADRLPPPGSLDLQMHRLRPQAAAQVQRLEQIVRAALEPGA